MLDPKDYIAQFRSLLLDLGAQLDKAEAAETPFRQRILVEQVIWYGQGAPGGLDRMPDSDHQQSRNMPQPLRREAGL